MKQVQKSSLLIIAMLCMGAVSFAQSNESDKNDKGAKSYQAATQYPTSDSGDSASYAFEKLQSILQDFSSKIDSLDGFDALALELGDFETQIASQITIMEEDGIDFVTCDSLISRIYYVSDLSEAIVNMYSSIEEMVDIYSEVIDLINNTGFKQGYADAQQILVEKSTITLSSYDRLVAVYFAVDEIANNLGFLSNWTSTNHADGSYSSKTWNFSTYAGFFLTFDWVVSSESGYDKLRVYLDGNLILEESGEQSGRYTTVITTGGSHSLYATYSKDGSVNNGTDNASISFYNGSIWELAELRKSVAAYISTLDSLQGLKSELQSAYDSSKPANDSTGVVDAINSLTLVYNNVTSAVRHYQIIQSDLVIAGTILQQGAYVDIAEAVTLGESIVPTTSTSADYLAAYLALESSLAVYNSDQIDMTDWSFNTVNWYTIDGLRYSLDRTNRLAEFMGFDATSTASKLEIPAVVRVDSITCAVVSISNANTYSQPNITEVVLPKSLRKIGDNAFYRYSNLRSIVIPENVTTMGSSVFYGCSVLRNIKVNAQVPPTLGSLGGASYKKVTIPASSFHAYRLASQWSSCILIGGDKGVTVTIESMMAGELSDFVLTEAGYMQEVNNLVIMSGEFNNSDWSALKNMSNLVNLDISGLALTSIPSSQFRDMYSIESIDLPNSIKTIGSSAFRNTFIKQITLPENLETISDYAFYNCDSLKTVVIHDGVTSISSYCFYDCNNLVSVTLPDGLRNIDSYAFYSCSKLNSISLPDMLTTISEYAFYNCSSLRTIVIPDGVTSIPYGCFYDCNNLASVTLPDGLKNIDSEAFYSCSKLDSITLPGSLQTISSYAFRYCSSLNSVKFAEGLKYLYENAFANCTSLTEVSLPSSLQTCSYSPFYGCTNMRRIEARSMIAPVTNGSCPLSGVELNNVVLYVPVVSLNEYKSASGWSSFITVQPSMYLPENITVSKNFNFSFRDSLEAGYRPNIDMIWTDNSYTDDYGYSAYQRGSLKLSSRSTLNVNNFSMYISPYAKYYSDRNVYNGYEYDSYRTQYNSTPIMVNGNMRAENVTIRLMNYRSRWQFITFPFDVRVRDIVPVSESTSWVIRGHDGAMRAAGKNDSVWVNLTSDAVLEAGKGYIMHCYNPNSTMIEFTLRPLTTSVTRQNIFTSDNVTVALDENLAEFDHNRSWNLIGNPYPCFYDTRFMDFSAPFMVWNSYNQNYVAYNPADDDYILSPGESFFVQRPFDQESLTFLRDGRQTDRYAREMASPVSAPGRGAIESRTILNLTIAKDSLSDRTRIVFNEKASMAYELNCDAAKFASTEKKVPQIFTISGNTRYAINERPYLSGEVSVGVYCGSEGEYSISLASGFDGTVILKDNQLGVSCELSQSQVYTFHANAGECLNRFVLIMQNNITGVRAAGSEDNADNGRYYNLQGIEMNGPEINGIYIRNGKKVVVK